MIAKLKERRLLVSAAGLALAALLTWAGVSVEDVCRAATEVQQ